MEFQFTLVSQWPSLAWLAECTSAGNVIQVHHGNRVETRKAWFGEAVWAGNFSEGDFDRTDIVAGSGARIRDEGVYFISSGSNVDRLHVLRGEHVTVISNSLVCLLAWVDGSAQPDYVAYGVDFATYRYALFGEHSTTFPSSAGPVELVYFDNLRWDGRKCSRVEKPLGNRSFATFADYRTFLGQCMAAIAANAACLDRTRSIRFLCPISNGYDSPTVAVLAREAANFDAFTFARNRDGHDDSGAPIAERLGIPCKVIDFHAWRRHELAEVPFLACSRSIGDLAFKSAEHLFDGTVFLSGATGGSVWKMTEGEELTRLELGDGTMLGFTEYRLWAGFIHVPVPLWGVRQIQDIKRISASAEMKPWDIGGNYSRPICRRIVEEAGIPRDGFGNEKKGVSVVSSTMRDALSPSSYKDFLAWLRECRHRPDGYWASLPSPLTAQLLDFLVTPLARSVKGFENGLHRGRSFPLRVLRRGTSLLGRKLYQPYFHHHYVVHWALERAKQRYSR